MPADPAPRKRRARAPRLPRAELDALGGRLDASVPLPEPAGLGEGMLLRARQDAMRNDAMDQGLLGRIAERSDANGKALDALNGRLDRIDDKLEGVAYRRDIEQFMARSEIEAKIERAITVQATATKESVAIVTGEVNNLRALVKWGGCGLAAALGGILLKMILAAAHVPT